MSKSLLGSNKNIMQDEYEHINFWNNDKNR